MHGEEHHGRHRRRRTMERRGKGISPRPLSECREDTSYMILENSNKQSMEMGLFGGAHVRVIRNSMASPNMVVGVNDSRYMLSKETASKIIVG